MNKTTELELVVFDLDGLLVDSESLQFEAYRDVFSRHGAEFDYRDWPRWHQLEASARRWIEAQGLDLDAELIREQKKQHYEQLIETRLKLKPGARELIENLSGQVRLCVASGSRIESIEACLARFSLLGHFEQLFSATTLKRKKPHPDVYLEALGRTSVSAFNAIALEDSPTGLQAALGAGILCVVCPDSFLPHPPEAYEGAARIVGSLADLDFAALRALLKSTV